MAVIEQLAIDFRTFAPELVATRSASIRIYRDTRFSDDKTPLKTNIAASFPWRGLHAAPGSRACTSRWRRGGCGSAAACMRRDTPQLAAVREHIAGNHTRLRAIVESPGFRRRRRARRREAAACAARLSTGPSGRRVPPASPVPRGQGISGGVRVSTRSSIAGILGCLPPGGAARQVPERTADRSHTEVGELARRIRHVGAACRSAFRLHPTRCTGPTFTGAAAAVKRADVVAVEWRANVGPGKSRRTCRRL